MERRHPGNRVPSRGSEGRVWGLGPKGVDTQHTVTGAPPRYPFPPPDRPLPPRTPTGPTRRGWKHQLGGQGHTQTADLVPEPEEQTVAPPPGRRPLLPVLHGPRFPRAQSRFPEGRSRVTECSASGGWNIRSREARPSDPETRRTRRSTKTGSGRSTFRSPLGHPLPAQAVHP